MENENILNIIALTNMLTLLFCLFAFGIYTAGHKAGQSEQQLISQAGFEQYKLISNCDL